MIGIAAKERAILTGRGYSKYKLKTVLTSRAIGGFLDVALNNELNYQFADNFKNWVLKVGVQDLTKEVILRA